METLLQTKWNMQYMSVICGCHEVFALFSSLKVSQVDGLPGIFGAGGMAAEKDIYEVVGNGERACEEDEDEDEEEQRK